VIVVASKLFFQLTRFLLWKVVVVHVINNSNFFLLMNSLFNLMSTFGPFVFRNSRIQLILRAIGYSYSYVVPFFFYSAVFRFSIYLHHLYGIQVDQLLT